MKLNSKIVGLLLLVASLVACQHTPSFQVNGVIANAEGKTLYLEHTALVKTTIVDSCVLGEKGDFALNAPAPEYPDFYRLRVANLSLPLAVDSNETISVFATCDSLPLTSSINGSEQSLTMAQLRATARNASRENLREAAKNVIVANPKSLAAYYALFLKLQGESIWNILDPADRRMYQAVATSFNTWMPNYERSKALYNQVRDVLSAERAVKQQVIVSQMISEAENAFLDITLTDDNGKSQSLENLKGKVVVLDFSAIEMEQSKGYIFELRDLYNAYNKRGMEIYSVSLDRNKLLWEDGVLNLPWINVYAGEKAGEVLVRYNVQTLPTLFLLDRKGNVQGRYSDFKALEADINKYL